MPMAFKGAYVGVFADGAGQRGDETTTSNPQQTRWGTSKHREDNILKYN